MKFGQEHWRRRLKALEKDTAGKTGGATGSADNWFRDKLVPRSPNGGRIVIAWEVSNNT